MRQLIIGLYISYPTGHHPAAWKYNTETNKNIHDINKYLYVAKLAEEAFIDFIFLADTPSVFEDDKGEGYSSRIVLFEPMTLLSSIATVTKDIGLIATSSTTYKEPFNLAREYASLDHISQGRAGWNLVTSSKLNTAGNFGYLRHLEHKQRYMKAEECWNIVTSLWDSWEDDAFLNDKINSLFYNKEKYHKVTYQGKYLKIFDALLNISRPPQGYPLLVQAGSSLSGLNLAAKTAEVVFTAQPNIFLAKKFYNILKYKIQKYNRYFKDIFILPGLSFYIDKTEKLAYEQFQDLQSLVPPKLGLSILENLLGGTINLSNYDVNKFLPVIPVSNANKSRKKIIEELALNEKLTIKELYQRIMIARGHLNIIGSYDQVANIIYKWFSCKACDGFNIMPPVIPDSLEKFIYHIIPRLQDLGIYKKHYAVGTLRDKLNIPKPKNKNLLV